MSKPNQKRRHKMKKVKIDTWRYEFAMGEKPHGFGHWLFRLMHENGEEEEVEFSCNWGEVRKYLPRDTEYAELLP